MDSMVKNEDKQDKIFMELIKNTTKKFFTVGSKNKAVQKIKGKQVRKITKKNSKSLYFSSKNGYLQRWYYKHVCVFGRSTKFHLECEKFYVTLL